MRTATTRTVRCAGLVLAACLGLVLSVAAQASATPALHAATSTDACTPGTVVWMPEAPAALAMLQGDRLSTTAGGAGVLVAVVDSGVDTANAHLADAIAGGTDLVTGSGTGSTDTDGHGTAIAGIIAARRVDGSGVVGIAPQARILVVRVFTSSSDEARKAGTGPTPARVAAGIRYAAAARARVINVSLSTTTDDADLRAAVDYATAAGSLVVASAGNRDTSDSDQDGARYPAAYPGVLAVAAVNAAGAPDAASIHGPHVGIAAPGSKVLTSATGSGDCLYAADAAAAAESSFATAYASGAAALVAAAHPDETPAQWAYRLEATAVRPDPDARDDEIGWGVVQPYEALTLVPGGAVRGPANPFVNATRPAVQVRGGPPALVPDGAPWATSRHLGAIAVIVGAATLGILGPVMVLRRRRRGDADAL